MGMAGVLAMLSAGWSSQKPEPLGSIPAVSQAAHAGCPRSPAVRSELSFDTYEGYLIGVEGRIQGVKHLRFILDTAATRAVVDRKLTDRLGLRTQPPEVLKHNKLAANRCTTHLSLNA